MLEGVPTDYIRISSGAWGRLGPATSWSSRSVFEGKVKGVPGTGFARTLYADGTTPFLDQLHRIHRHRAQHHAGPTCAPRICSRSPSRWPRNSRAGRRNCRTPTQELQEKARLLAYQNQEVERKEPGKSSRARQAPRGKKAKQPRPHLQVQVRVSLANMSPRAAHAPSTRCSSSRTNSPRTPDGNLTNRQTEFAKTIHSSGNDLLMLINDILDLSKIEVGARWSWDAGEVRLDGTCATTSSAPSRHVAREQEAWTFFIELDPMLPKSVFTDAKRLQQVLKNLLSNRLQVHAAGAGSLSRGSGRVRLEPRRTRISTAPRRCWPFSVTDTGIGHPRRQAADHLRGPSRQADGSTSPQSTAARAWGWRSAAKLSRLLGRRDPSFPGAPRARAAMFHPCSCRWSTRPRATARRAPDDPSPSSMVHPRPPCRRFPAPMETQHRPPAAGHGGSG